MKTVFDLATREELIILFGDLKDSEEKNAELIESHRQGICGNESYNKFNLAMLFSLRGDEMKANEIAESIADFGYRYTALDLINGTCKLRREYAEKNEKK